MGLEGYGLRVDVVSSVSRETEAFVTDADCNTKSGQSVSHDEC